MSSHPLTFLPIEPHQDIKVRRLLLLEGISPNYINRPRPQYFHFTRQLAKLALRKMPPSQRRTISETGNKIFLSRSDDALRPAAAVDTLLELEFMKRGYSVVQPRRLSICQKLAIASRAKVIAGRWGSGNLNMLFAPAKAMLVDIQSPFSVHWSYRGHASCGDQLYTLLVGEPLPTNTSSMNSEHAWDVSIERIHDLLEFIKP